MIDNYSETTYRLYLSRIPHPNHFRRHFAHNTLLCGIFALAIATSYFAPPSPYRQSIGRYVIGGGKDTTCYLTLYPGQLFVFDAFIDNGGEHHRVGWVEVNKDIFTLHYFPTQNATSQYLDLPIHIIPVQWGDRQYLITGDTDRSPCSIALSRFCQLVNQGSEPRNKFFGRSYLRISDLLFSPPASGVPTYANGTTVCNSR